MNVTVSAGVRLTSHLSTPLSVHLFIDYIYIGRWNPGKNRQGQLKKPPRYSTVPTYLGIPGRCALSRKEKKGIMKHMRAPHPHGPQPTLPCTPRGSTQEIRARASPLLSMIAQVKLQVRSAYCTMRGLHLPSLPCLARGLALAWALAGRQAM